MKKIVLITTLVASFFVLQAQSVQEGNKHLYYERLTSAEKAFAAVLASDANNAEAWFGLTKTQLLQEEKEKARTTLSKAPQLIYEEPYYNVAKGWLLLSEAKADSATFYFNNALKETKEKNASILSEIAQAHINEKKGNAAYAVELLNKAIKREKNDAGLYVQLGDAFRKMADGSEAYKAYKSALEKNDKYALAFHRIGQIFLTQKNAELYLDYFNQAIAADPAYAPSLYKLYLHYFYYDAAKAMQYYTNYMAHSDPSKENEYDLADLLYLTKSYDAAIQKAKAITQRDGDAVQPRLYKLISYSYAGMGDTTQALIYMQQYFTKAPDTMFIAKDYLMLSALHESTGQDSLAVVSLANAVSLEKDSAALYDHYKKLADISAKQKDFAAQALWMGKYYEGNKKANNVDLFNWGIASYRAEDYIMADSVFGRYVDKYPKQSFGYYWQAKSKALIDTGMKEGLAVPAYQSLITVLETEDSSNVNYKKWMVEAYRYLAAYETNQEKDYAEAVNYFEKILEVDPANEDAKKYIVLLEKRLEKKEG